MKTLRQAEARRNPRIGPIKRKDIVTPKIKNPEKIVNICCITIYYHKWEIIY